MPRHRFTTPIRSEQLGHLSPHLKRTAPAAVHSPRRGLIVDTMPNQLYRTPVAVTVSATGERTLHQIDPGSVSPMNLNNTNPFANDQKEPIQNSGESSAEEVPQSYQPKRQRAKQQRRRKLLEKDRRKSAKSAFTQRSSRPTAHAAMKSTSSQTEPELNRVQRRPECVGDSPRWLTKAEGRPKGAVTELALREHKLNGIDKVLAQFMPESLKMLTSFVMMIILIFWITSVVLDVDVPADLFRMAANYVRSFKWGQYKKPPQTNAEKFLEYATKFFK